MSVAVAEAEGALGDWLCVPGAGCERTGALLAADTAVYGVIRPSAVDAVLLVKQAPAELLLVPMRWGGAPGMHALVELCREDWFYEDGSNPLLGAAICDVSGDGMSDDIVAVWQPEGAYGDPLSLQMPMGGERVGDWCEDAGRVRAVTYGGAAVPEDVHCADYNRDGDEDIMRSDYRVSFVGPVEITRNNNTGKLLAFVWGGGDGWPEIATQVDFAPFLDAEHPDVIIGAPEPLREQAGFVAVYPWQLP